MRHWEYAEFGDPAHDLAIVTRGARKPQKESGGFQRLLETYNEASGTELPESAVRIHELLMHLAWLAEASEAEASGKLEGHGPEHYAEGIAAMLRRFR
jgi:aminoglycoside phosphotransferase (APT) family kinase protein